MTIARKLLERVLDGGSCSIGAVAVDAQLASQFVCRLEPDPPNVIGELVGVLLDFGDGLVTVGAIDPDCPTRTDAVVGQEQHDLADFSSVPPNFDESE